MNRVGLASTNRPIALVTAIIAVLPFACALSGVGFVLFVAGLVQGR